MTSNAIFEIAILAVAACVFGAMFWRLSESEAKATRYVAPMLIAYALIVSGDDLWQCAVGTCRPDFVEALMFRRFEFWVLALKASIVFTFAYLISAVVYSWRHRGQPDAS